MSEQTPNPDSRDDVEGHMPFKRFAVEDDAATAEDVEGHMPLRRGIVGDDDVESSAAKEKD